MSQTVSMENAWESPRPRGRRPAPSAPCSQPRRPPARRRQARPLRLAIGGEVIFTHPCAFSIENHWGHIQGGGAHMTSPPMGTGPGVEVFAPVVDGGEPEPRQVAHLSGSVGVGDDVIDTSALTLPSIDERLFCIRHYYSSRPSDHQKQSHAPAGPRPLAGDPPRNAERPAWETTPLPVR